MSFQRSYRSVSNKNDPPGAVIDDNDDDDDDKEEEVKQGIKRWTESECISSAGDENRNKRSDMRKQQRAKKGIDWMTTRSREHIYELRVCLESGDLQKWSGRAKDNGRKIARPADCKKRSMDNLLDEIIEMQRLREKILVEKRSLYDRCSESRAQVFIENSQPVYTAASTVTARTSSKIENRTQIQGNDPSAEDTKCSNSFQTTFRQAEAESETSMKAMSAFIAVGRNNSRRNDFGASGWKSDQFEDNMRFYDELIGANLPAIFSEDVSPVKGSNKIVRYFIEIPVKSVLQIVGSVKDQHDETLQPNDVSMCQSSNIYVKTGEKFECVPTKNNLLDSSENTFWKISATPEIQRSSAPTISEKRKTVDGHFKQESRNTSIACKHEINYREIIGNMFNLDNGHQTDDGDKLDAVFTQVISKCFEKYDPDMVKDNSDNPMIDRRSITNSPNRFVDEQSTIGVRLPMFEDLSRSGVKSQITSYREDYKEENARNCSTSSYSPNPGPPLRRE